MSPHLPLRATHRRASHFLLLLVTAILCSALCSARGETPATGKDQGQVSFIRLHSPPGNNPALQVAIASYRDSATGTEVDLVGAVHVADSTYYDELNTLFEDYDAVLFEMIGGRDGLTQEDITRAQSPVSSLRNTILSVLEFEFQLEGVDYSKDNFFHADMSAEDFAREKEKKQEGMLALLLRAAQEQDKIDKAKSGSVPKFGLPQLLRIVLSPSGKDELKHLFAQQLILAEGIIEALEKDGETVIVSGRNRVAMQKLREIEAAGKRRIAVFYGAAHLAGMERLLVEEGNFIRTGHRWITAWDIQLANKKAAGSRKPRTPHPARTGVDTTPTPSPSP